MKKLVLFMILLCGFLFAKSDGIISSKSKLNVSETSKKLQNILKKKNINIFKVVEHSKEAKKVGLNMKDTEVVIFGAPKVGTILMKCSPKFALDLPLKFLIFENEKKETIVTYESIKNIAKKYDTSNCNDIINKLSNAQEKIFKAITK